MRLLSVLLATLALTNVMAQTTAPDSFCVKYAKILFNKNATTLTGTDQYNLISAVVGRVVVGCDNNAATQFGLVPTPTGTIFAPYGKQSCGTNPLNITVVKGLVSDPLNAPFFAGTAPNYQSQTGLQPLNDKANPSIPLNPPAFPSIRFVGVSGQTVTANPASTGANGTEGLIQHLVSFFGGAFGCVNNTASTPSTFPPAYIGKYNGIGSMATVHQNMNITGAVWNEFINTFNQTLLSFGVSTGDVSSMVVPIVSNFLLGSGTNQICNDPATCACAPINGQAATNVNGTCVAATAAPGTTTAPPTATTAPPTSTTSPPTTHGSASTVAISAATIFGAVLIAFL